MAKHEFKISKYAKKHKVHPRSQKVDTGDKLEWEAKGTAVQIFFPKINGLAVVRPNRIVIAVNAKGGTTVVLPHGPQKVHVPYAVYCAATNNFAEGGSDPKIIVN